MSILKKYKMFIISLLMLAMVFVISNKTGMKSVKVTFSALKQMLIYIPPLFVLLGLLDIWVPKKAMVKLMGEKSGALGIALAIIAGSCSAGPIYGAFPVAAVLMKKGVKFTNILIFIGTWSCAKIAMVLFEIASLGAKFAFARLLIDIPGIIIMAFLVSHMIPEEELNRIYAKVEDL